MPRVSLPPEERRAQIVATAKRLFAEKGIASTKVSDIATATGTAQGTFYLYVKSKDEVVGAIAEEIAKAFADDVKAAIERREGSSMSVLVQIFDLLLVQFHSDRDVVDELHRDDNRRMHEHVSELSLTRLRPDLLALVERGVAEGTFTVDSPAFAVDFVASVATGFRQQDFADDDRLPEKLQAALHFCLRGLGVTEEPLPRLNAVQRDRPTGASHVADRIGPSATS